MSRSDGKNTSYPNETFFIKIMDWTRGRLFWIPHRKYFDKGPIIFAPCQKTVKKNPPKKYFSLKSSYGHFECIFFSPVNNFFKKSWEFFAQDPNYWNKIWIFQKEPLILRKCSYGAVECSYYNPPGILRQKAEDILPKFQKC